MNYLCDKQQGGLMKTDSIITLAAAIFLLLFVGCKSSPLDKRATGLAYEIVVTTDAQYWNGEVGEALKADLRSAIPGLPQVEPSMRVTYAKPKDFNGLLTYVKNILIVNINPAAYTKVALHIEEDRWANGQSVVTLNAPDSTTLVTYLQENPRLLAKHYTRVEMARAAALCQATFSVVVHDKVKELFGVTFKVPETLTYHRSGDNFFWASNNAGTGRTDIVVYTFPYLDRNTFTKEYLIAKRDSVMKLNMPGSFPDSYMATETRFDFAEYEEITQCGKYCGVLRGLWRMEGDMMGGPFVSHARLDETNNRVVVVEGFVYAPETDKRNYIRRIEAALYTLRLPGDPVDTVQ